MISQDKQIDDYLSIFVPVIWFLSHTAFLLKLFRYSILEQKETMFGSLCYHQCKKACEEYTSNGSGEGCGQVENICPLYCLVAKSCSTLCNPKGCRLPGASVHGISQARIPEWVAISFSNMPPLKAFRFTLFVQLCRQTNTLEFGFSDIV